MSEKEREREREREGGKERVREKSTNLSCSGCTHPLEQSMVHQRALH